MISIEEAQEICFEQAQIIGQETIRLEQGLGRVLAQDLFSEINMPPFDQSAMDGYALLITSDEEFENRFEIIGEIQAGMNASAIELNSKTCARIYTGAMIPPNSTHVVPQEFVVKNENHITINKVFKHRANIRDCGEQIKIGEKICEKATILNSGVIGYLASLGVNEINVYQKPKVSIINTGDELQEPGTKLELGRVYESNGLMLETALQELELESDRIKAKDTLEDTKKAIASYSDADILILTGGISVGDYDFVKPALESLGTDCLFYKVKQKPGKPFYFGKKGKQLVFALPGNPAAVLTCFHIYVKPVLKKMMGFSEDEIYTKVDIPLSHNFEKKGNRPQFLKAFHKNGMVTILGKQSSAMLGSFIQANCFVYLQENDDFIQENDLVTCYQI